LFSSIISVRQREGSGAGSGSVPMNNGSGSGRPKISGSCGSRSGSPPLDHAVFGSPSQTAYRGAWKCKFYSWLQCIIYSACKLQWFCFKLSWYLLFKPFIFSKFPSRSCHNSLRSSQYSIDNTPLLIVKTKLWWFIMHTRLWSSVADPDPNPDPDPPDPHVFGPPGSGSESTCQRYGSGSGSCSGSGSGSFYHYAKIVRKTLIPTILW
jgi:hypothetical protein